MTRSKPGFRLVQLPEGPGLGAGAARTRGLAQSPRAHRSAPSVDRIFPRALLGPERLARYELAATSNRRVF